MTELHGQTCIVTGGARGIGLAVVEAFLQAGAVVHCFDLAAPATPGKARHHACDIADAAAVERVLAGIPHVDVLVNNAATVTRPAPFLDLLPEEWALALAVNVTGAINVMRAALRRMGAGGRIVNLASTFAHVGAANRVAYSTTKGAILAFSRSLALELAPQGIRVNSISPGGIATERLVEQFGSERAANDALAPLHPIGRLGRSADIADAVLYLASPRAAFVTGADMLVDGGYTAR